MLAKHIIFILISIAITNVFIMWFTGPSKLIEIIKSPINEYKMEFIFMVGVSLFYYWVYAYLREQICTFFCPYGRLQGVLLDSKSISVMYDYKRGEPRGVNESGDCINCRQCVAVCPTGIDIRNGSQLECINCTACIDECNQVMKKIKKPGNLIRFDSFYGIETGRNPIKNFRTYAYSSVLVVLTVVLGITLLNRSAIDVSIIRMSGTMYQLIDTTALTNIYTVKVINKTSRQKQIHFELIDSPKGSLQFTNDVTNLKADTAIQSVLIIKLPKYVVRHHSVNLKIGVYDKDKLVTINSINFIGPQK